MLYHVIQYIHIYIAIYLSLSLYIYIYTHTYACIYVPDGVVRQAVREEHLVLDEECAIVQLFGYMVC